MGFAGMRATLLVVATTLAMASPAAAATVSSTFDADADGWTVAGDPQSLTPAHVATGGNPGRFVRTTDSGGGGVMYWSAPSKFLGDRSAGYGANLRFDLRQSSVASQFDDREVVLEGAGQRIFLETTHPGTDWTPYTIPLTAGGWMLDGTTPRPATPSEMAAVLGALTALRIRAEYVTGGDVDDLDNVVLEESAAPPDGDGDGVPNALDACPAVPAATANGCPTRVQPVTPAALAPPVLGRSVNVTPVSGEVFVSVPAGSARASALVPGIKGRTFVPLGQARQIPVGSILDTRKGTVRLASARDGAGAVQTGEFSKGVFEVSQSRRARTKGLTDLVLKGSSFSACRAGRSRRAAAARSKRTVRRLRANAKGRFRTRGRYASATVRGTTWTLTDRCDGTLTSVSSGKVAVRDLRRRKTVVLKAGRRYLAQAPR